MSFWIEVIMIEKFILFESVLFKNKQISFNIVLDIISTQRVTYNICTFEMRFKQKQIVYEVGISC